MQCNEFLPKVEPELARLKELKIDLASIDGRIERLKKSLASLAISVDFYIQQVKHKEKCYATQWYYYRMTNVNHTHDFSRISFGFAATIDKDV